jgi:DNA-binding Xre family transcriptional regulator
MISYEPLHQTLRDKKMVISDMRDVILNSRTIAKIGRNESVRLETIDVICQFLEVPIERVVRITINK